MTTLERLLYRAATVPQLRSIARQERLTGYSNWNKSELVQRLHAAACWKQEH